MRKQIKKQLPHPTIITPLPAYQRLGAQQLPSASPLQQRTSQFYEILQTVIKQPTAYEIPQLTTCNQKPLIPTVKLSKPILNK